MRFLRPVLGALVSVFLVLILNSQWGTIPPIGKFLNPYYGFWNNAEDLKFVKNATLTLPGLNGRVEILFDDHKIPHIFAENEHDLYFAQGYITARDRLFQMDIQTRLASGRLAEVVGPKALSLDIYHRRMGMVFGAENTLNASLKDSTINLVINAYSDGVNAYIKNLKPENYPLEFKLLNYSPEPWIPLNTALLLKLMSETLAGGSNELMMTRNLEHFGPKVMKDLFPDYSMHEEPIIPIGSPRDFVPLPIPKASSSFLASQSDSIKSKPIDQGIGSNNWAISGTKTENGFPLLANDPHLHLTLPSIWYQVQLSCKDLSVNGVSLPGSPNIIIGYNSNISWGVTNVDADVLDWYQIKFKDNSKNDYWYNQKWEKTHKRIEVIKVRGGKTILDTVVYTHHGPVVYSHTQDPEKLGHKNIPVGDALRWIAHDPSDELRTFYILNRAKNYSDYRLALTYYTAPAQNFVFASNEKDIAITPNGKFPLKYRDQGKYILDGSDPKDDWHGWIPYYQNPSLKNPERGFVSSANQTSTGPDYPYYINWQFGPYERGKRIDERLSQMKNANQDSMRILQNDNLSIQARDILPTMIGYLDSSHLNLNEINARKTLLNWNYYFDSTALGASIFNTWWLNFYALTWNDEFNLKSALFALPSRDRTEELLIKTPNSHWFDNIQTPEKESAKEILNQSFHATIEQLIKSKGPMGPSWAWGKVKKTYISHLANIPGLGIDTFSSGGGSSIVNALRDGLGPSWRMVVQMGHPVKGFGILPGGESGNPGSFYYNDQFKTWKDGKLNDLIFFDSKKDQPDKVKSILILRK